MKRLLAVIIATATLGGVAHATFENQIINQSSKFNYSLNVASALSSMYGSYYGSGDEDAKGDLDAVGQYLSSEDSTYIGAQLNYRLTPRLSAHLGAGFLDHDDGGDANVLGVGLSKMRIVPEDRFCRFTPRILTAGAGVYTGMGDDFDMYQLRIDAGGLWPCQLFGGLLFYGGIGGVYSDVDPESNSIESGTDTTVGPQFRISKELSDLFQVSVGYEQLDKRTVGASLRYSF